MASHSTCRPIDVCWSTKWYTEVRIRINIHKGSHEAHNVLGCQHARAGASIRKLFIFTFTFTFTYVSTIAAQGATGTSFMFEQHTEVGLREAPVL